MTVFLTTQYLEEADVLADRVGIIDHGQIVAEGTPRALKAEIGRPTVEARARPTRTTASASRASLARFGEPCGSRRRRRRAASPGETGLADVVRALDAEGLEVAHLQLHAPTLDDVFLAKTGRSLEGAERGEPEPEEPRPRRRERGLRRPGRAARPALGRAHAPPAGERRLPARLPARCCSRSTRAASTRRPPAGLPDATRSSPSRSRSRSSRARSSRR